jgi:hypothetical protein
MNRYVLSTLAALAVTVAFAMNGDDAQADHGYGCGAPVTAGCAGDYGCSDAYAGCGGRAGRWFPGRLVLRAATAPVRAVRAARFAPGRRFGGCG